MHVSGVVRKWSAVLLTWQHAGHDDGQAQQLHQLLRHQDSREEYRAKIYLGRTVENSDLLEVLPRREEAENAENPARSP